MKAVADLYVITGEGDTDHLQVMTRYFILVLLVATERCTMSAFCMLAAKACSRIASAGGAEWRKAAEAGDEAMNNTR